MIWYSLVTFDDKTLILFYVLCLGSLYKVMTERTTWANAKYYCESVNAELASMRTFQESEFIKGLHRKKTCRIFFFLPCIYVLQNKGDNYTLGKRKTQRFV